MSNSEKLAWAQFGLSLIMIFVAACLSHYSAVRVFRQQNIETKTMQLLDAKKRFDQDLTFYGQLVRTIGERDLGMDFNTRIIPNPDAFFLKVFETGIHDLIVTDVMRLRELGFDIFLESYDPSAQKAFKMFFLKQQNLSDAKKAELVGRFFLENGFQAKLAAISYNDIHSFILSR